MTLFLGILIFSSIVNSIAIVPFIDFLYRAKFIRRGTPLGGGMLIISTVTLLYALLFPLLSPLGVSVTSFFPIKKELNIIFFTFISFGLLGFYNDIIKIFGFAKTGFFGLRIRHKLIIQTVLAVVISLMLFFNLQISIINIPFFGVLHLGWWYIPLATFIILAFTNAFNISDSLDGLSCGVLIICLLAFWALSVTSLDTPLSVFIALWIGALISFLYFNVYPARIRLGNVGSLSFGATLAVVGLLLGKIVALVVIGGIFLIAPFHHWLRIKGWEEPKIVMRAWLAAVILAIFGLWLAQL